MSIKKNEITKFINETIVTNDNKTVPRYSAGDIYQIFSLYKRDKELVTCCDDLLTMYTK